jgi:hypothetical protein
LEVLEARHLPSTYVVDRLTDIGEGDGLAGDLRYCISQAGDGDAVTFAVTGGINLTGALAELMHSVAIEGPGTDRLILSGAGFSVGDVAVAISGLTITSGGVSNGGTLTISDFTIEDGYGIDNGGRLTVTDSTITRNVQGFAGGGIQNWEQGVATISNCVISENSPHPEDMNFSIGGGIYNVGRMTITNSTVTGNYARDGGAIYNGYRGGAVLFITNSTISGNSAGDELNGGTGGISNARGGNVLSLRNTIVAGNRNPGVPTDLDGSFSSRGHNAIGQAWELSGIDPTDLLNVDPLLGPLQDNGGPTQTMALLPGSPALNAGDPAQLGTADQRGVIRTGGVNIGAFQASASAFVLTVAGSPTAGVPFDLTVLAVDLFGQVAVGYTGTVTFATDDPDGAVPPDYTFTTADAGSHTFAAGVTLYADGSRVIATDTQQDSLTGSVVVPLG